MRVEYEVDEDKMNKFLNYLYTTNNPTIDEFFVVVSGYIIDNNLLNYPFDVLTDLCEGDIHDESPMAPVIEDLTKFYWDLPSNVPLTEKSIRWLEIGVDFILTNCKEYMLIKILKNKIFYNQENKAIREYIIKNKDEFPDMYLELIL